MDDDNQGQLLRVLRDHEPDRWILADEGWSDLAVKGWDSTERFVAFSHTLRWHCTTATDTRLFQAPFRAGITIDAYQMEPLRKAPLLPRVNTAIRLPLFGVLANDAAESIAAQGTEHALCLTHSHGRVPAVAGVDVL